MAEPKQVIARGTSGLASGASAECLIVMDLDGVMSPVHGRTQWGDDVVVSPMWGGVLVSPMMCERLERLADHPSVQITWLTSWDKEMRASLNSPFPGSDWPVIADPLTWHTANGEDPAGRSWWKWQAVKQWLADSPDITSLVWCDDHLRRHHTDGSSPYIRMVRKWMRRHTYNALLISPQTDQGLTPADLDAIEAHISHLRV